MNPELRLGQGGVDVDRNALEGEVRSDSVEQPPREGRRHSQDSGARAVPLEGIPDRLTFAGPERMHEQVEPELRFILAGRRPWRGARRVAIARAPLDRFDLCAKISSARGPEEALQAIHLQ